MRTLLMIALARVDTAVTPALHDPSIRRFVDGATLSPCGPERLGASLTTSDICWRCRSCSRAHTAFAREVPRTDDRGAANSGSRRSGDDYTGGSGPQTEEGRTSSEPAIITGLAH